MKKRKKRYFVKSIRARITFPFVILTVMSLLSLAVMVYKSAYKSITAQSAENVCTILNKISGNVEDLLEEINQNSKILMGNEQVQDVLSAPDRTSPAYIRKLNVVHTFIHSMALSNSDIDSVLLYDQEGTLLTKLNISCRVDLAGSLAQGNLWEEDLNFKHIGGSDSRIFQLVRPVRNLEDFTQIGYLQVNVKIPSIEKCFSEEIGQFHGNMYIADSQGVIIAQHQEIHLGVEDGMLAVLNQAPEKDREGNNTYVVNRIGDEEYFVLTYDAPPFNWRYLSIIQMSEIVGDLSKMTRNVVLITAVLLLCAAGIILMIARNISRPIVRIADSMKQFEKGDFSVRSSYEKPDEIGYLSSSFNKMAQETDRLINEVYQLRLLEQEQEIKLLQAQINPHFLYNTLDTIYYLAQEKGEDQISQLVLSFSKLMRASMRQKSSLVTLESELQIARDYLNILQIRYGSRLRVEFDIEEGIENVPVPKMTLQPLVENAIVHGLEPKAEDWHVRIAGYRQGGTVLVEVTDNGVGMTDEKRKELLDKAIGNCSGIGENHFGLQSVMKRICLLLGASPGVELLSEEGKGTAVRIILPGERKGEDVQDHHS